MYMYVGVGTSISYDNQCVFNCIGTERVGGGVWWGGGALLWSRGEYLVINSTCKLQCDL